MSRLSFPAFFVLAAGAIFFAATLTDVPASAQENVKILTPDGIKLHGVFYASEKKNAPTVMMLHAIGEGKSSKGGEWKSLAESLQKSGYSVMLFDFRGHGESTTIDDPKLFFQQKANAYIKLKEKEVLDVKDYLKAGGAYLPVLVNDIAAVRAYLDRRNDDTKDCNTSNLIVIGADSGATLGALWMNAEWHRFKYSPPMGFGGLNPQFLARSPEGKDIIAAVFLTVQPTLEKKLVSVSGLLKVACKDNATAALFLCGKEDAKATNFAKTLEEKLKPKNSKKHDYIGHFALGTNLSGANLLKKGLNTESLIGKYLDNVVDDRRNDRVDREFRDSFYIWKTNQLIPAHKKGEKTLIFDDYSRFLAQ
jgi:alpha/beta hydrolase family protein